MVRATAPIAVLAALLLTPPAVAQPDGDLPATLRRVVDGSPLASARTGIFVAPVETGEEVYAKDPDTLLNPASNVKLVTTAAALTRFGPEFRFSTEFLSDEPVARGGVRTLYVRGGGDPSLVTERLFAIAGDLYHLGLRKVGELVLDDGYFDVEGAGPGYDQEDGDHAYLAPASCSLISGLGSAPGPFRKNSSHMMPFPSTRPNSLKAKNGMNATNTTRHLE